MKPWDSIIGEEEQRRYRAAGFGRPTGIGTRPALLVIDVQYRTVGTKPMPFWDAVKEFPTSCGETAWAAVRKIEQLLGVFRENGWPVLYPYVAPKEKFDAGRLAAKNPALMKVPQNAYEFVAEIAPRNSDVLLPKKHPSAFYGTPLASYLIDLGVDTLVVTGCTTSGCVRGSVVDAFSYNFRVIVPYDCVYDRSEISHAVNLFDMSEKYGDVMSVAEALQLLKQLKQPLPAAR
ncbi:MAG TPA: isochorismatase family protein [Stellaceae bacterium]|nr:isochorismatase family protein [Stellaceae bacterium]